MRPGWIAPLAALALVACSSSSAEEERPRKRHVRRTAPGALAPVGQDALCATRGKLVADGARLAISEPTVRMVAPASHGDVAALRFTYRGPSDDARALKSGQLRRQLGLKLRAADGCNLVYVMWRIEPGPGIEVSVKRNPGRHTADDCGTEGYTKVKPQKAVKLGAPQLDASHTLEARITGDGLTATVDGEVVWEGKLPAAAAALDGPAGLRTDNVAVDAELLTAPGPARKAGSIPGCD